MKELTYNEKISLIKKYYKKSPVLLELSLINYDGYDIYIILNNMNKTNSYRLSWFDLSLIEDSNIEKYLSCTYISSDIIESIKEYCSNITYSSTYYDELYELKDIVILNANIKTKVDDSINITFKKYLPENLEHLCDLFIFIFRNMPKEFEPFLFKLTAELTGTTEKYEYKKEFEFNLFNDDIDKIFKPQIIQRGKKYYEESKIKFLEKIDDRYFAIVEGTEKYLTIIKYDEEKNLMQVYCSCPCEFYCKHMYAVILAIRKQEFNRFYKIMYKNPDKTLLERVMEFEFLLCLGVVEQNLEIVSNNGQIELIPILDINGKNNWKILEDSKDEKLMKQMKYFLENK